MPGDRFDSSSNQPFRVATLSVLAVNLLLAEPAVRTCSAQDCYDHVRAHVCLIHSALLECLLRYGDTEKPNSMPVSEKRVGSILRSTVASTCASRWRKRRKRDTENRVYVCQPLQFYARERHRHVRMVRFNCAQPRSTPMLTCTDLHRLTRSESPSGSVLAIGNSTVLIGCGYCRPWSAELDAFNVPPLRQSGHFLVQPR